MLKSECKNFLLKLKNFNREKVGIDDELIAILYEMTIVIDDYYALNQMMDQYIAPIGNAAVGEPKGSQMLCDVCNVKIIFFFQYCYCCGFCYCVHYFSTRCTSAAKQMIMPYMRKVNHID